MFNIMFAPIQKAMKPPKNLNMNFSKMVSTNNLSEPKAKKGPGFSLMCLWIYLLDLIHFNTHLVFIFGWNLLFTSHFHVCRYIFPFTFLLIIRRNIHDKEMPGITSHAGLCIGQHIGRSCTETMETAVSDWHFHQWSQLAGKHKQEEGFH